MTYSTTVARLLHTLFFENGKIMTNFSGKKIVGNNIILSNTIIRKQKKKKSLHYNRIDGISIVFNSDILTIESLKKKKPISLLEPLSSTNFVRNKLTYLPHYSVCTNK